ncbi:Transcription factor GTE1 [Linum grandiflorum]
MEPISEKTPGIGKRLSETNPNLPLHVDKAEEKVEDLEQRYSILSKNQKQMELKEKKEQSLSESRMQELMRQFGTVVLGELTQHKWAGPFMEPVDVEGLGLDHYYEVIDKPMDFSTIKARMESKDGTGYNNVREIYSDVRLIFNNAMKYNEERSDVYGRARTLLEKFEDKWLQFLPKVTEEERRREEEESEAFFQEMADAKMAIDLRNEVYELDEYLHDLREMAVQNSRKWSIEDKKKLSASLTRLSPEDLTKALEIVAQYNPGFQATAEEVDLDIDALSDSVLWRLKLFVKAALKNDVQRGL